jgi:hypothetical protein
VCHVAYRGVGVMTCADMSRRVVDQAWFKVPSILASEELLTLLIHADIKFPSVVFCFAIIACRLTLAVLLHSCQARRKPTFGPSEENEYMD